MEKNSNLNLNRRDRGLLCMRMSSRVIGLTEGAQEGPRVILIGQVKCEDETLQSLFVYCCIIELASHVLVLGLVNVLLVCVTIDIRS